MAFSDRIRITAYGILRAIRGNIPAVVLWAILFVLLVFLFRGAAAAERMYPDFSLRYSGEISGERAKAARLYSINAAGQDGVFWPTFWREDALKAESDTGAASCTVVTFSGDGALAWDADFLRGSMPGAPDAAGCALSAELASSLFGSLDVVGMEVEIDGAKRVVRGVFEGSASLALVSAGEEATDISWHAAELGGDPENANRSAAESYSTASGLGRPAAVFAGDSISLWARLACFVPAAILIVFCVVRLFGLIPRGVRGPAVFAVCLAVALLLPAILRLLPGWAVPDMWSDFSYWASLADRFEAALRELLGNAPYLRDVEGKLILLRQGAICFAATLCAIGLCFAGFRSRHKGEKE